MTHTFRHVPDLPALKSLTTQENAGKRHYLLPSGLLVPSVTTVLGYFKAKSLLEWRKRIGEQEARTISSRASVRGTKLHTLLEKYVDNNPISGILTEKVMPDMKQSFYAVQKVLDKRLNNIHYVEAPLFSEQLYLAGRTDVIGEFDDVLSIVDFKTSLKEKKEDWIQDYFLQSTAYSIMCEERTGIKIPQIVVIIVTDDLPEPQVFIKESRHYQKALGEKLNEYFRIHGKPVHA